MDTIETDWSKLPEDYCYTAVDMDGMKYAYVDKPNLLKDVWCSTSPRIMHVGNVKRIKKWHNSLRQRSSTISTNV